MTIASRLRARRPFHAVLLMAAVMAAAFASWITPALSQTVKLDEEDQRVESNDFEVNIHGFVGGGLFFGGGNSDGDAGAGSTSIRLDGQVQFDVNKTLENGIEIGAYLEIEGTANTGPDDVADCSTVVGCRLDGTAIAGAGDGELAARIDEFYLWGNGAFGQVKLGAEDSASTSLGIGLPDHSLLSENGLSEFDARIHDVANVSVKANKLTYISPQYFGVQGGVSYTPDIDDVATSRQSDPSSEAYALGVRYRGDFSSTVLNVGLGYEAGSNGAQSPSEFALGATVDFLDASIGAIYRAGTDVNGTPDEDTTWGVGVSYEFGDTTVGVRYRTTTIDYDKTNSPAFTEDGNIVRWEVYGNIGVTEGASLGIILRGDTVETHYNTAVSTAATTCVTIYDCRTNGPTVDTTSTTIAAVAKWLF